mmetsp:Transcript_6903/g.14275  ORF Transcript_6903/g.14275 Transcript_6903/m.14275 type:complete len:236 (+) Transcript_6903:528-1235(+)
MGQRGGRDQSECATGIGFHLAHFVPMDPCGGGAGHREQHCSDHVGECDLRFPWRFVLYSLGSFLILDGGGECDWGDLGPGLVYDGLDGLGRGCPGSPWSHRLRGLQHHIHLAHRAQVPRAHPELRVHPAGSTDARAPHVGRVLRLAIHVGLHRGVSHYDLRVEFFPLLLPVGDFREACHGAVLRDLLRLRLRHVRLPGGAALRGPCGDQLRSAATAVEELQRARQRRSRPSSRAQ